MKIRQHLFPGDGKEAAAVALCARRDCESYPALIVREVHPIPHDVCSTRAPDAVTWPVSWLDSLLEQAGREQLSIVKFHSHPTDYRQFSETDDRSDTHLFQGINAWMDREVPHGSIVMLSGGNMFGRIISPDGRFNSIGKIAVVGDDIRFWHSTALALPDRLRGVGRQTPAFGKDMTAELAHLSIAFVGASGTGSIGIEQAARLGFGRIVTIDPQTAEIKNLNRIVNATRLDAEKSETKVEIARRSIEAMGLGSIVEAYNCDLVTREAIEAVASCDIIFGCVDSAEGRDVLNRISSHYLLPYIDVGVGIVALSDGTIDQVNGVVHYIQPGKSSLLSRRAYRPGQVAADAMRRKNPAQYEELRREKYIKGANEEAPAVISVNMMMASLAMNELLSRLYPIRNTANRLHAALRVSLTETIIESEPETGVCPLFARFTGAGDTRPLLGLPELSA